MSEKNTGGPAFPESCNGFIIPGMTLRDYFAAQALVGLISSQVWMIGAGKNYEKTGTSVSTNAAESAYEIADAMLKERDK